jgi:hypothetical protein
MRRRQQQQWQQQQGRAAAAWISSSSSRVQRVPGSRVQRVVQGLVRMSFRLLGQQPQQRGSSSSSRVVCSSRGLGLAVLPIILLLLWR